jgi:hypothetical protein
MPTPSTADYRAVCYWKNGRETLLTVARTRRGVAVRTGRRIPEPHRFREIDFIAVQHFNETRREWALIGAIAEPEESTAIEWLEGKAPARRRRRRSTAAADVVAPLRKAA